jgi:type II secretory pathway component PulL
MPGSSKDKKWAAHDLIWIAVGLAFGLFLVFVVYLFLHLWKESTLRQLLF